MADESSTPRTLIGEALEYKSQEKTTRIFTRSRMHGQSPHQDGLSTSVRRSPRYASKDPSSMPAKAKNLQKKSKLNATTREITPRTMIDNFLSGHDTVQQSIRKRPRLEPTPNRRSPRRSLNKSSSQATSLRKKATLRHFRNQDLDHGEQITPRSMLEAYLHEVNEETPIVGGPTLRRKSLLVPNTPEGNSSHSRVDYEEEESFVIPSSIPEGPSRVFGKRRQRGGANTYSDFTLSKMDKADGGTQPLPQTIQEEEEEEAEEEEEEEEEAEVDQELPEMQHPENRRSTRLSSSTLQKSVTAVSVPFEGHDDDRPRTVSIKDSTRLASHGDFDRSAAFGEESAIVDSDPNFSRLGEPVVLQPEQRHDHSASATKSPLQASREWRDGHQATSRREEIILRPDSVVVTPKKSQETEREMDVSEPGAGDVSGPTADLEQESRVSLHSREAEEEEQEEGEEEFDDEEINSPAMDSEPPPAAEAGDEEVGESDADSREVPEGHNDAGHVDDSYSETGSVRGDELSLRHLSSAISAQAKSLESSAEFAPLKTPVLPTTKQFATPRTPLVEPPVNRSHRQSPAPKPAPKPRKKTPRPQSEFPRLPTALTRSIFTHFCNCRVDKSAILAVERAADQFWKNMTGDLAAFVKHANRSTVEECDVELLMRRQGFVTDDQSLYTLVEKWLPLEYRQEIIPIARSGNKVVPKH